jgi:hypothetical protein
MAKVSLEGSSKLDRRTHLATHEQIEEMAKAIWPQAKSITVTSNRAGRFRTSSPASEGFTLAVTDDSGLIAAVSAQSLDKLKTKLERRDQKRNWGDFD